MLYFNSTNGFSNFVSAYVRKDCGGHIESVFALSLTENVAVFNM